MNQHNHSHLPTEELGETLTHAVEALLADQPSAGEISTSLNRLRQSIPKRPTNSVTRRVPVVWRVAAPLFLMSCLWWGAQTTAWGAISHDYQTALKHAVSETDASPTAAVEHSPAPLTRFVLLVHVFGLLAGMAGFLAACIRSQFSWFLRGAATHGTDRGLALLNTSWSLYAVGTLAGCLWSWQVAGVIWRWDPRETAVLLVLAIGLVWFLADRGVSDQFRKTIQGTLAFWMILLVTALGSIYASRTHSYGFTSSPIPNILTTACVVNLAVLGMVRFVRRPASE